jgi:hypothetical protein
MYPRRPLPHAEQLERLRRYLRRLRTETKHRYEEIYDGTGRRRECAFEVSLRQRQVEAAQEIQALAEACLHELMRQEALFFAPFKPGDRITAELVDRKQSYKLGPYLIVDIEPDKRFGFVYEVVEITKSGAMHKGRWRHPLSPRKNLVVHRFEQPVSEEAEAESNYYRECAKTSRVLAFERGDLTLFEAEKHLWGSRSFRRRDRTTP